ncbi:hypothetical protein Taro_024402 [Colocasia esculenta]|uniref:Retrotransposon gag domain-containing protein n=1 Tax=Colocasia esculenta TaxID=4460 RepID=A0A843VEC8_COLES|nr:hypothetical protein [Colocasia esculenta]
MQIDMSKKHSNNKGWMQRLFFVRHRDGAPEFGFPTRVQTARKESYPFLIQDEAKASDSLNRVAVRNDDGYLTEFQLVEHELAAGQNTEAMEDYAEKIAVTVHLLYEGESEEDVSRPSSGSEPRRSEISGMADRRDWGGGGEDPEESTQRMIERIWESLTDIRARMDQQAPVPPVAVPPGDGEAVPVAPVPPRVEVPFAAPVPPPPPVLIAEEIVMQVEKFLRLQPPTYSRGPNPDTAEHWVHEIERVFATMRCPAADRVVLAAYQLRGFALEWWRLKMQTTFVGRTEEAITWSKFLDVLKGGWTIVERVVLLNCARKRRGVVQFPWELAEGSA